MSLSLLQRVKDHVVANGLDTDYAIRYFRWTDAEADGNTPLMLFRQSGSGSSDPIVQNPEVSIILLGKPTTVVDADQRAHDILRLFRGTSTESGVIRFEPAGTVMGPMYLENGRPVFELVVRCFTEDQ